MRYRWKRLRDISLLPNIATKKIMFYLLMMMSLSNWLSWKRNWKRFNQVWGFTDADSFWFVQNFEPRIFNRVRFGPRFDNFRLLILDQKVILWDVWKASASQLKTVHNIFQNISYGLTHIPIIISFQDIRVDRNVIEISGNFIIRVWRFWSIF